MEPEASPEGADVASPGTVACVEPVFGTTVLALPEAMTFDQWADLGGQLRTALNSTAWWVGDWLVFAFERWPDPERRAAANRRLADLGFEAETVARHFRVCALFPPTLRHESLSFSHHEEVSRLELEDACDLLIAAHDHGWSCRQLRKAVKASKAIETTGSEVAEVHGIAVRFTTPPAEVVVQRLARGIEKTLRDLGLDGDVTVR